MLLAASRIDALQEKTDAASAAIADEGTALDSIIAKYNVSATDREGMLFSATRLMQQLTARPTAALLNWRHSHDF